LAGTPCTITISKDPSHGEILVLTTDGISSRDHARVGEDSHHKLWQEIDPHLREFLEKRVTRYLRGAVSTAQRTDPAALKSTLEDFLQASTFDDDATLGVLISSPVFEYFHKHFKDAEAKP
jgi:hypothetical protein